MTYSIQLTYMGVNGNNIWLQKGASSKKFGEALVWFGFMAYQPL